MAITETDLLMEIGGEALDELTEKEKNTILATYSTAKEAAMKAFWLLSAKYKPTYRMGSAYEELSSKYKRYWDLYCYYAKTMKAGYISNNTSNNNNSNQVDVDRWKWPGQTR